VQVLVSHDSSGNCRSRNCHLLGVIAFNFWLATGLRIRGSNQLGARGFKLSTPIETGPGAQCVTRPFLGGKVAGAWHWPSIRIFHRGEEWVQLYLSFATVPSSPAPGSSLPFALNLHLKIRSEIHFIAFHFIPLQIVFIFFVLDNLFCCFKLLVKIAFN